MAKGKNGQLPLIIACNKLLKQAFTIVKSEIPYPSDFAGISAGEIFEYRSFHPSPLEKTIKRNGYLQRPIPGSVS